MFFHRQNFKFIYHYCTKIEKIDLVVQFNTIIGFYISFFKFMFYGKFYRVIFLGLLMNHKSITINKRRHTSDIGRVWVYPYTVETAINFQISSIF